MSPQRIATAFRDIRRERDPNLKSQKLASLVSALFRARGIELVVVGGSAIEFYTDKKVVVERWAKEHSRKF